jgi:hypothetical protein
MRSHRSQVPVICLEIGKLRDVPHSLPSLVTMLYHINCTLLCVNNETNFNKTYSSRQKETKETCQLNELCDLELNSKPNKSLLQNNW